MPKNGFGIVHDVSNHKNNKYNINMTGYVYPTKIKSHDSPVEPKS